MRISRTNTNTTVLREPKRKAKVSRTEIARLIANLKSASRSRTPLPRRILASTIQRRNTLVRAAPTGMTAVAIAAAEDAGVDAADAAAEGARKAAAISLPRSTRLLKEISAPTIPGA